MKADETAGPAHARRLTRIWPAGLVSCLIVSFYNIEMEISLRVEIILGEMGRRRKDIEKVRTKVWLRFMGEPYAFSHPSLPDPIRERSSTQVQSAPCQIEHMSWAFGAFFLYRHLANLCSFYDRREITCREPGYCDH